MKKYSNFQLTNARGTSILNLTLYATVDVTTKKFIIFGKETTTPTKIFRDGLFWKFMDNGMIVPDEIDRLSDVAEARHSKPFNKVTEKDFKN